MIEIDITIEEERWHDHDFLPATMKETVQKLAKSIPPLADHISKPMEISLVLSNNENVQALNRDYRGKDKPTNVLSFPQQDWEEPIIGLISLGDIIIAYETIFREAEEQHKSFHDHALHMLTHGLLHLCGYDHIENDEAEEMETLEIELLKTLGIKNPYES